MAGTEPQASIVYEKVSELSLDLIRQSRKILELEEKNGTGVCRVVDIRNIHTNTTGTVVWFICTAFDGEHYDATITPEGTVFVKR